MAQMVMNLPAMQVTWVSSWVWKIPQRREWKPTPIFLPRGYYGQVILVGYSSWGHKELDMIDH